MASKTRYSEIVYHLELEQKLNERQGLVRKWPDVGLIEVHNGIVSPQRSLDYENLIKYFSSSQNSPAKSAPQNVLRIFLLQSLGTVMTANGRQTSEEESAAVNPLALKVLREKAGLSNLLIAATCATGHWYTVKHTVFQHDDQIEKAKSFQTFYSFVMDIPACMQFFSDFRSNTYFCLNLPTRVVTRFVGDLQVESALANRLFYLDVILADEVMMKWQGDMKTQRDTLKTLEKKAQLTDLDGITRQLHALSQSWYIHFRKLSDFEAFVRFIQSASRSYSRLSNKLKTKGKPVTVMDRAHTSDESLKYLSSSCQSLRHLVTDYRGRTNIQINLLFHLTNQEDSRANIKIAELTAELARKTRDDSTSMITIAVVTLFFLPGTFVASFLNSVFFNFAEHGIKVSDLVWIFPATTVPLTVVVFSAWLGWMRWRRQNDDLSQWSSSPSRDAPTKNPDPAKSF